MFSAGGVRAVADTAVNVFTELLAAYDDDDLGFHLSETSKSDIGEIQQTLH